MRSQVFGYALGHGPIPHALGLDEIIETAPVLLQISVAVEHFFQGKAIFFPGRFGIAHPLAPLLRHGVPAIPADLLDQAAIDAGTWT